MFTAGGGPGEVHSYFSPYESPMDAFVAAQTLINDFEARLRLTILTANEPFLFYTSSGETYFTGVKAWSLKGFIKALETVDVKAVEFHAGNGDFEKWAQFSLKDPKLAESIKAASTQKGETLRKTLIIITKKRFTTQSKQVQEATELS
jgi:alpha-amylase